MTEPIALTDEQVCELLALPTLTANQIAKLRRKGQFPPYTILAGRKLVLRADLDAWIEQQREQSAETVRRRSELARKSVSVRWGHPQ
jgi:hypothetical protein